MSLSLEGIAASSGIAFGKAYKLIEPDLSFEKKTVENSELEITKLHNSLKKAKDELSQIRDKVSELQGEENARIFDAHLLVLQDPDLLSAIREKINSEKINAASALYEVTASFINMFEQMENEYMRERSADIKDVTKRVLAHLLGKTLPNPGLITEETILITKDLTPSDTAQINKKYVKGFIADIGGRTSHSAIMARSMELPAIVGTKEASLKIKNGDNIIIDGMSGKIFVNPSKKIQEEYRNRQEKLDVQRAEWAVLKDEPTVTKDNYKVELAANIGSPKDIEQVKANGSEGIGLYRTEFLYMERTSLPTEEEQFEAYKTVLHEMNGKPVIVRTLDIGGDKQLSYWDMPKEINPFLGLRAIRFTLKETTIFRTQLRALLRASHYGNLKIMFPMIATLDEFHEAKQILIEEKQKLQNENVPIAKIEVGIMVETPATALVIDQFAKEVDFFSIGTNDLIQYTFAADRMNEYVSYLYQPYHPAILRLVKMVIDAAHAEGKWVGMCGEMAGDRKAIPLLLGLGLDEFSMSASSILPARSQLKNLSKKDMELLAEKALLMKTTDEVLELVKSI